MIQVFEVPMETEPMRIDQYLTSVYEDRSRSFFQNLIRSGQVTCNDQPVKKTGERIEGGDCIAVDIPPAQAVSIAPEPISLDILYEDNDLLIINKPKGMVVHPAAGHYSGTLVNAVLYHCKDLSGINGEIRPGIVHRIDKDTTGSLIVCKNDYAHQFIAAQLKEHSITRRYRGIVHEVLKEDSGTIQTSIGRSVSDRKKMAANVRSGRPAVTHYRVLERFSRFTYCEFELETGRTHQIRVHMSSIRHPILGDTVYGPAKPPFPNLQGQTLHAMDLGFTHPSTGQYMEITAPLPQYFEDLLTKLRNMV